jgi:uncharacterized protein YjiS (DUF1127 family)
MSVTTADFIASSEAASKGAIVRRVIGATVDWVRRRYSIHMHRRVLHSLPDHVLKDIGISRSMIDGIVPERLDAAGRPIGPYPF